LSDFNGKRVAVISQTTTEKVLRDSFAERSIKAEVVTVRTRAEGLKLVENGKVDGFAADRTTLIGLMSADHAPGTLPSAC
jgi:ABC-type amino acid transport substrate-binding protein